MTGESFPQRYDSLQEVAPGKMDRVYVPWNRNAEAAFEAEVQRDPNLSEAFLGLVFFSLLLVAIVAPLLLLIRHGLGTYFYVSIPLMIAALYWFFFKVLPPPFQATAHTVRRFRRRLRERKLRDLGLNASTVAGIGLAGDGDTLRISVPEGWLQQTYEKRLKDAQKLWRLWAEVYSPYDGCDKARIIMLDSLGDEVGGSKPEAGSLIWVR